MFTHTHTKLLEINNPADFLVSPRRTKKNILHEKFSQKQYDSCVRESAGILTLKRKRKELDLHR